jgi:hypothetical protein
MTQLWTTWKFLKNEIYIHHRTYTFYFQVLPKKAYGYIKTYISLCLYIYISFLRQSLTCSPCWPGTFHPPASACQVLDCTWSMQIYLNTNVHSSFVCNSPKLETFQSLSTAEWINKLCRTHKM